MSGVHDAEGKLLEAVITYEIIHQVSFIEPLKIINELDHILQRGSRGYYTELGYDTVEELISDIVVKGRINQELDKALDEFEKS